ncbi:MAG: SDR family oxidoreductase [Microscillaceae bacterium]|nr:SDR family oxidoreductase [Microscillaceae bacterium]
MKDKVVIITGASSGIGKALAFEFGSAGANIVITGRNQENLHQTSKELTQKGINNLPVTADVSVLEDNALLIDKTLEKYGKLDILINNAGMSMRSLFEEVDIKVIRQLMEINFFGTVYATKYALPHIIRSQGSIVGISSIAGYRGLPARTGYSASKFAMHGFLESLRTELLKKNVHILLACPGFTQSNIRKVALTADGSPQAETPRNEEKMMNAEEVAHRILKAVQKRKRDLVLTRQGKLTVFLNKWLPAWMDKMVYQVMAKEPNSPFK